MKLKYLSKTYSVGKIKQSNTGQQYQHLKKIEIERSKINRARVSKFLSFWLLPCYIIIRESLKILIDVKKEVLYFVLILAGIKFGGYPKKFFQDDIFRGYLGPKMG